MRRAVFFGIVLLLSAPAHGDALSTGRFGINSRILNLTGDGIAIGQVEPTRPGKPGFDTDAGLLNSDVEPMAVFLLDGPATIN